MQRFSDWPSRLEVYIRSCAERKFAYGKFDCCLFVCDAVQAMTGVDPAQEFRDFYHSRKRGRELLFARGGFQAIAQQYEMPNISPSMASRGDIVQLGKSILGIVAFSGHEAMAIGITGGLVRVPLGHAITAWRVG